MKAIVIREHGGVDQLRYEDVDTPTPGPGEVVVRIRAAGVNHFRPRHPRGHLRYHPRPAPRAGDRGRRRGRGRRPRRDDARRRRPGRHQLHAELRALPDVPAGPRRRLPRRQAHRRHGLGHLCRVHAVRGRERDPAARRVGVRDRGGVDAVLRDRLAHGRHPGRPCAPARTCWSTPPAAASAPRPSRSRSCTAPR